MDSPRQGRPRPPWPALPLWCLLPCWLLVGHLAALPRSRSPECYVCGPQDGLFAAKSASGQTTPEGPTAAPPCHGFTPDDARFRRRCPLPFEGCIHERDDMGNVARSCGNMAGNMCTTANNITYCYCREPLCNAWRPDTGSWPMGPMADHGYVGDSAYRGGDGPRYREDDDDEDAASFEHSGGGPPPPSLVSGGPIPPTPTARPSGATAATGPASLLLAVSAALAVLALL